MFDTSLFLTLSAVSMLALVIGVPVQVDGLLAIRKRQGLPVPPRGMALRVGALAQQALMVLALAALGTWLAPRVGLRAPVFDALNGAGSISDAVEAGVIPTLVLSLAAALVFLALYYLVFRPRLDPTVIGVTEELRFKMGLPVRLLMGGIVEEVMFRWGVMTVLAWIALDVFALAPAAGMWGAIVVAGIVFGLGHLPAAAAMGVAVTRTVLMMAIALNLVVGLACGWLFWQYGLWAAMFAHGLVHLLWWPFDRRNESRVLPAPGTPGATAPG